MSLHIQKFIDRVRAAESRQQRDVVLSVVEARDLHADITRLLLALEQARSVPVRNEDEVLTINVNGGNF
jgi:hypothetical protein